MFGSMSNACWEAFQRLLNNHNGKLGGPIWFEKYDQVHYLHVRNGRYEYRIDSNGTIEHLEWTNYDKWLEERNRCEAV